MCHGDSIYCLLLLFPMTDNGKGEITKVMLINYGTAHTQVYKQMCVMCRASRNFEGNLHIGLV